MTRAIELFFKGGLVMYPLVLASIFVVAITIERIIYYRQRMMEEKVMLQKTNMLLERKDYDGAEKFCGDAGALGEILKAGLDNRTLSREIIKDSMQEEAIGQINDLKNNLGYLDTIVTMAPLLGLLGTVVGMIGSFSVLDVSSGKPFAITGGVAEALIATATGLGVAILSLLAYTYLNSRVERYITSMEKMSAKFLRLLQ